MKFFNEECTPFNKMSAKDQLEICKRSMFGQQIYKWDEATTWRVFNAQNFFEDDYKELAYSFKIEEEKTAREGLLEWLDRNKDIDIGDRYDNFVVDGEGRVLACVGESNVVGNWSWSVKSMLWEVLSTKGAVTTNDWRNSKVTREKVVKEFTCKTAPCDLKIRRKDWPQCVYVNANVFKCSVTYVSESGDHIKVPYSSLRNNYEQRDGSPCGVEEWEV